MSIDGPESPNPLNVPFGGQEDAFDYKVVSDQNGDGVGFVVQIGQKTLWHSTNSTWTFKKNS